MCWSKEISLATFILGMAGVVYLYQRNGPNDRWIAIFGGTVVMIQLAEFFMWSDLACGATNKWASIFAMLVLVAEPVANMLGGIYFSSSPYKKFLKCGLVAYAVFILWAYFGSFRNREIEWCGTTSCGQKMLGRQCNLSWKFVHGIPVATATIWIAFLALPLLAMEPRYQGTVLLLLGAITFWVSKMSTSRAFGSLWCWFAIVIIYAKILI